jgi:hypothetical protein
VNRPTAAATMDEILTRFGQAAESVQKLAEDAARAEAVLGIHGVSVTARTPKRRAPYANRSNVEKFFRVHETVADPLHRTVELPKPVTQEVADQFNHLFGRI